MISALCSVAIAFSPTAPLQPRAAAMHMTRAATSEVAMINLFGNSGARSPALKGERVGTFGKGGSHRHAAPRRILYPRLGLRLVNLSSPRSLNKPPLASALDLTTAPHIRPVAFSFLLPDRGEHQAPRRAELPRGTAR